MIRECKILSQSDFKWILHRGLREIYCRDWDCRNAVSVSFVVMKAFFEDNHRYDDLINVIDIRKFENTEVFHTDVKQVFDFIRCSEDKKKLVELVENDVYYTQMDEEAFDVVTQYTNSKELIKAKEYVLEGGKRNVCKAIRDLMDDGREEGRELLL